MEEYPKGQKQQLFRLAGGLVLAMSPWFSTSAVLGELREVWRLSDSQAAWLIIVVQIGFISGAMLSTAAKLADRIPPRRLLLIGTLGAAAANMLVVISGSFSISLVARFLTGAFLAAVYPPALKAMSSWYRKGRGFALGVMIGALTLGSALPHLVNAVGGLGWRETLTVVSIITVIGGVIADRLCEDGPFMVPAGMVDFTQIKAVLANRDFRLASAGYFRSYVGALRHVGLDCCLLLRRIRVGQSRKFCRLRRHWGRSVGVDVCRWNERPIQPFRCCCARHAMVGFGRCRLWLCLLYTSPSPRDKRQSRMPSSA